jgi:hypothetical protein
VERYAVHKITKVDHAIPHNTVIAEVTNQITGEESTGALRWDQHVTTEEPIEVAIGDTGKITVELALQRDEEDRPLYRYKITDEAAGIGHEGVDLRLGARLPADNTKAVVHLLTTSTIDRLRELYPQGPLRGSPLPPQHRRLHWQ